MIEQFAKSRYGNELYSLQDMGKQLGPANQADMTAVQKKILVTAKAYWESEERADNDFGTNNNRIPRPPR